MGHTVNHVSLRWNNAVEVSLVALAVVGIVTQRRLYVCLYVCMYVRMHVCMYVWMYVCMCVCLYVCMCVCVCARVRVFEWPCVHVSVSVFHLFEPVMNVQGGVVGRYSSRAAVTVHQPCRSDSHPRDIQGVVRGAVHPLPASVGSVLPGGMHTPPTILHTQAVSER